MVIKMTKKKELQEKASISMTRQEKVKTVRQTTMTRSLRFQNKKRKSCLQRLSPRTTRLKSLKLSR